MRSLKPTAVADGAAAAPLPEQERRERLWGMTAPERTAAFYRGELTFGDCLAWARRFPREPPLAADGEYLFIAVRTPDWADDPPPRRRGRHVGREL